MLFLDKYKIGEDGAVALVNALLVNGSLLELDFECKNIGEFGAGALAGALRVNRSLVELKKIYNWLRSTWIE
jgi:hypothetical protein